MVVRNLIVALAASSMLSGCFCMVADCGGDAMADDDTMRMEQSNNRAEDAALRAESAADKAEAIFNKGLQK